MELNRKNKGKDLNVTLENLSKEKLRIDQEKQAVADRIKALQDKNRDIVMGGGVVVIKTGFSLDELESAAIDSNTDINTQKIHFLKKSLRQDYYSDPGFIKAASEYVESISDAVEKYDAEILKNVEAREKARKDLEELKETTEKKNILLRNAMDELLNPLSDSVYGLYGMNTGTGTLLRVKQKLNK